MYQSIKYRFVSRLLQVSEREGTLSLFPAAATAAIAGEERRERCERGERGEKELIDLTDRSLLAATCVKREIWRC